MKQIRTQKMGHSKEDGHKEKQYWTICPNCEHKEWIDPRKCSRCGQPFFLKLVRERERSDVRNSGKTTIDCLNSNVIVLGIGLFFLTWLVVSYWEVLWRIYQF